MYATPAEVLAAAGVIASRPVYLDANGCAIWPDWTGANGYGYFKPAPKKLICVHRAVYVATAGQIPDGWHVDHVYARGCRSRACFWPGHLEAVTPAENARRTGEAIRDRGPRPCGHSWDDDRPGRNDCKICHREQERARHQAKGSSKRVLRVRLIRELAEAGHEVAAIANQAQCSLGTVHRILSGKTCANVF